MARRRKAHDPAALARQSLELAEREAEIARLVSQGVNVKADPARRIITAWRSNPWKLLLDREAITLGQSNTVNGFTEIWATWKGLEGRESAGAKVDNGSSQPHTRALITDRMIKAGKDVAWTLSGIPQPHRGLLEAFMVATVEEDRPMAWRGVVEREMHITRGKTHNAEYDHQLRAVVFMLDALVAMAQSPKAQHRVAA